MASTFKLFGFRIKNREETPNPKVETVRTFAPVEPDGSIRAQSYDGYVAQVTDFNTSIGNENRLITTYRELSMTPEVDLAIEDIVSEMVVSDEFEPPVKLNLNDLKLPESAKIRLQTEFDDILRMMDFKVRGHDIVKRWYVDGRYYLHILIDEKNPTKGIQSVRYIDPRNLKLVRETIKDEQMRLQVDQIFPGVYQIGDEIRYWLYLDPSQIAPSSYSISTPGLKIAYQSVAYTNSGIVDPNSNMVLSFLHKAIRSANQLKMLEDAQVIYMFTRAPDRRVVYIDTGELPQGRAEQYRDSVIRSLKNRINYDAVSGEVIESRKFVALTEDIYIPRRAGSTATTIDPLPGGQNVDQTGPIEYFKKKLANAMNVPYSRMSEEARFSLGKSVEVSRDEAKYARFVARLRTRFSMLFDQLLSRNLALKGLVTLEEWDEIKDDIHYDFLHDNYFAEMIENEVLIERMNLVNTIEPFKHLYFSEDYIRRKILRQSDEEMLELEDQREEEEAERKRKGVGLDGRPLPPPGMDDGSPYGMGGVADQGQFDQPPPPGMPTPQTPMDPRKSGMIPPDEELSETQVSRRLSEAEEKLAVTMSDYFSARTSNIKRRNDEDFDAGGI